MSEENNMQHYDPHELLGEFHTKLWLPQYRPLEKNDWSLKTIMMAAARGYWGETYKIAGAVILSGPATNGRASWMSMLPSEIESQEIGLRATHGYTVVVGLGMGWLAANVALRHEVNRVTVVERDRDVIELVEATGVFAQLPEDAQAKLEIVQADALNWRPSAAVDTLQADIWERFIEDRKLSDIRHMQDNIGATSLYFWGQEMEIWRFACRSRGPQPLLDWPLVRTIVSEDIQLPLFLPDWPDYPQKIAAAAPWWTPHEKDWWKLP
jgi:hypothetical protein